VAAHLSAHRATPERRRFPPPWSVEEMEACFIVKDHTGHKLAYVRFEDESGRRAAGMAFWAFSRFLENPNVSRTVRAPSVGTATAAACAQACSTYHKISKRGPKSPKGGTRIRTGEMLRDKLG